jgi:hypothetical protein
VQLRQVASTATPNAAAGASSAWLSAVQAQTNPSIATATGATPATTNWRPWIIARDHFDAAYNAVATYVADQKFAAIVSYYALHPFKIVNDYYDFFSNVVQQKYGLDPVDMHAMEVYFSKRPYFERYNLFSSYLKPKYFWKSNYIIIESDFKSVSGLSLSKIVQDNIHVLRTTDKVKTLLTNLQNAGAELAALNKLEATTAAKYIPNLLPRWYQAVYFIGADDNTDMTYIATFRATAGV